MRIVATLLNICLLILLTYLLIDEGAPGTGELPVVLLAFTAPLVSLIALYQNQQRTKAGLLALFLERKQLEEQQRIDQLRSNSKNA